jgi:ADP-ribosylglycohydrolase
MVPSWCRIRATGVRGDSIESAEGVGVIGAIAGDIIGSVYEFDPIKTKDFPLFSPFCTFTDDTVLTVAVAQAILTGRSYLQAVREIGRRYPNAGYGGLFLGWLHSEDLGPYNSWGNGSAMRVSPIGFAFQDEESVLKEAARTAEITHNHSEGVKGAQATALAIFLARTGRTKDEIRSTIQTRFNYDLDRTVDDIRPSYFFDVSCQRTTPEAIIAFLDSTSYEDAIRNAISLGGDSDTLACITGGIAEAFYGDVPSEIRTKVMECLSPDLWEITDKFSKKFGTKESNREV